MEPEEGGIKEDSSRSREFARHFQGGHSSCQSPTVISTLKSAKIPNAETVNYDTVSQTHFLLPLCSCFLYFLFQVASSYCENHVGSQDFFYSSQQITACGMTFFVIIRQKKKKTGASKRRQRTEKKSDLLIRPIKKDQTNKPTKG